MSENSARKINKNSCLFKLISFKKIPLQSAATVVYYNNKKSRVQPIKQRFMFLILFRYITTSRDCVHLL